jgi:tetratricopeptide (TPR) repeat protein
MAEDAQGLAVSSTSDAALAHYDAAIGELFFFREGVVAETVAALAEDPLAPMPNVLAAYLALLGTEPADVAVAAETFAGFLDKTAGREPLPREQAHIETVRAWLADDIHGAGARLAELSVAWPRDALALFTGHQIDFLTGDARSLRDRIGGALSAWPTDDPHYGHLLGMYGFGLEEAGHYDRSEDVALRAVELNPRDVWGIHAVAHTYEMQGRFGDGIRYYNARLADWSGGNFLAVHNWWHNALYALEAGETGRALDIYDASIGSGETVMELLDASALLWRLYLESDRQHERWVALAPAWDPKIAEPHYAFNDMHAVMAYLGADRIGDARELIEARQRWVATPHPGNGNHRMTADIGLPASRSLLAFAEGRYGDVVDLLYPIRHRINEFGGSHAQRDAVQRTLLEGALRAGRTNIARELISERINVRPGSPFNWLKQARLAELLADPSAAETAGTQAARLLADAEPAASG